MSAGWISAVAATTGAFAQTASAGIKSAPTYHFEPAKAQDGLGEDVADITAINVRAVKQFQRKHKGIADAKWYKMDNCFMARFNEDSISHTIYYLPNGNWAGSMKRYRPGKLPVAIRNAVTAAYPDYDISYVNEAETTASNGIPTYIIYLEGRKYYKWIRIYNDEIETWKVTEKQP